MSALPALLHRLAAVERRHAAVAAALAIALLSIPALVVYPGAAWRGILFCVVAGGLVPLALAIGHSPYRLLIAAFLALGFWAKFVAHFAVGAQFVEPLGAFADTPEAWDKAIGLATAGLAGVWAGLLVLWRLGPAARDGSPPAAAAGSGRTRLAFTVLSVSALAAAALFVFNYWFAILRIGFVPEIALPSSLYMPIAFAVSWGILLWVLALTWWLVERGRLPAKALMHVAAIEGAAAALSMGSRAQMLLHVVAAGMALWHGLRWRGWRVPGRGWIEIAAVFLPLFAGTLLLVQLDRSVAFVRALRADPTATATARPRAPAPATPATPTGPAGPAATPRPEDREADGARPPNRPNRALRPPGPVGYGLALKYVPLHLRRLVIVRWVGLDGVLAISSRERRLGLPLFRQALVESPAMGIDALFQRAAGARAVYPRSTRVVFMTIPGPVAFAAFSGSRSWCFAILLVLVVAGALLEYLAARLTANPAVGAVAGVALAYLVVQLNFPRTLLVFVIELVAAVVAIAVAGRFLREPDAGLPAGSRPASG